jgi:hypothetical protein
VAVAVARSSSAQGRKGRGSDGESFADGSHCG